MRHPRLLSSILAVFVGACATAGGDSRDPNALPPPTAPNVAETEEDESNAPPHALGTIRLGETRASATGASNPLVGVSFLPDSKLAKECTRKVGVCEIAEIPQCVTGTANGCPSGETCTFDDSCKPVCIKQCTRSCSANEECVFDASATSEGGMTCRKKDRFDAGAIAFDGTTMALTLFPPYSIQPEGNGAPFMPRSQIKVIATGGTRAGFEAFEETFTATTLLETDPPLADLPPTALLGTDDVPIGWRPGEDTVYVSVSGPAGVAKCQADDKSGKFEIPREVITEVQSSGTTTTSSNITISVSRERREVRRDKKTFGTLSGGRSVQPVGWLELITTSGESHSFTSCATGQQLCNGACTNVQTDRYNCGTCGNACPSTYICSAGTCVY